MFDTVIEMLSYPFMTRAFLVGSLVALCSALLGVSLVLKRYSMIGDGLSHVGFGAMAIAAAMNAAPLTVAIPVVIVAAILLLRISGNAKIKGDAAIALISTTSLAVGVMVISLTTGMNTDVYNYMFGSILAMSAEDVKLSLVLSVFVLILFIVFYHKIFAITFDETFARATGVCHSTWVKICLAGRRESSFRTLQPISVSAARSSSGERWPSSEGSSHRPASRPFFGRCRRPTS